MRIFCWKWNTTKWGKTWIKRNNEVWFHWHPPPPVTSPPFNVCVHLQSSHFPLLSPSGHYLLHCVCPSQITTPPCRPFPRSLLACLCDWLDCYLYNLYFLIVICNFDALFFSVLVCFLQYWDLLTSHPMVIRAAQIMTSCHVPGEPQGE